MQVPVAGGVLNVARSGPPPEEAAVVLAVHGITASHVAWRAVARALGGRACLLAPDLRGRGRSAALPGPYGMAAHAADLVAVLDHAGAERAVLAGHSLGAHIVARVAADHPRRAAHLVLVDGGLPVPAPPAPSDDERHAAATPAVDRMDAAAASAEAYVARWRSHPAFARAWNDDVEAYVRYDLVHDGGRVRCVVREDAVTADGYDLLCDGATRTAVTRVRAPIRLVRAQRGIFDDDHPMIPRSFLDGFRARHPHVRVEDVSGVNHYTVMLGDGPGPERVAAAIAEAAGAP
jgi:lipase